MAAVDLALKTKDERCYAHPSSFVVRPSSGAVSETELLQGTYPFAKMLAGITRRDWNADALDQGAVLPLAESQILLDAAALRFLEHNICFRETLGDETLLIFPGLIKQKRPSKSFWKTFIPLWPHVN